MMAVIIRLQNLPLSANASNIRTFFQGLKIPDGGVNIVGGEDGDAFIAFGTDDDARQAMHLSGQKINGVSIKLLLSSKQEMQKIITDAQNRVLKRSITSSSITNVGPEDKQSVTYYEHSSLSSFDNANSQPSSKMRIIDHSVNNGVPSVNNSLNNKENNVFIDPPRPSEFSYKTVRQLPREELSSYRYETPEYSEYTSIYNVHPPYMGPNRPQFDHNLHMAQSPHFERNLQRPHFEHNFRQEPSSYEHNMSREPMSFEQNFRRETPTFNHNLRRPVPEKNLRREQPSLRHNLRFEPHMRQPLQFDHRDFPHPLDNRFGSQEYVDELDYRNSLLPIPQVLERPHISRRGPEGVHMARLRSPMSQRPRMDYRHHNAPDVMHISHRGSSNVHHDYTERPQWLEESKVPLCNNCLVRVVLPTAMISTKTILDLFRNISIVTKHGIKIEYDADKRLTGYVYVLFMNTVEAAKALRLNHKMFRGVNVIVESLPDEEFDKVFENDYPFDDMCSKPFLERSPYYRDMCLEISNIPLDITERDLKDYLNISINNKKMHFIQQSGSGYCLIIASDDDMVDSILKFNRVSYRGSVIRVMAISNFQLETFLASRGNVSKPFVSRPDATTRKYPDIKMKSPSCARFENLAENTKASDMKQLFLPTSVPLSSIVMNSNSDECVVDFINEAKCQSVVEAVRSASSFSGTVTVITHEEFLDIKSGYLSLPGGHKSAVSNLCNKRASDDPDTSPSSAACEVTVRNFPTTISNMQVKDLIKNFEHQPRVIHICYENGRNLGEVILTFKSCTEAVDFKDEYHGFWYMQNELEVLLSEK